MPPPIVVIGAGHNGLVAACYLARAGREVLVLEADAAPGGGARTAETVPGHRFDLHSVAHNIINMTPIPAELDLAGAGLVYQEMDPFAVAFHEDGRRVRFHRSIPATLRSIAAESPADARAYADLMRDALPIVAAMLPGIRGLDRRRGWPGAGLAVARAAARGPARLARDLLAPYDTLLRRRLASDLTRGPVAAFAAHASMGPLAPTGAVFALWQAAYHRFGQWHARGGAQGLTDALVRRLTALGGRIRTGASVARIAAPGGRVEHLELESGRRVPAAAVVAALDPRRALLELLDPPLGGGVGTDLAATRRGNVVQAVVHVALDALPAYTRGRRDDHNGLQSYVDRLDDLADAWRAAEAGLMPDPLPLYAFTPSALDPTLAPPGRHTLYLACPAAPFRVEAGWERARDAFAMATLNAVAARAPGLRERVTGLNVRTPEDMAAGGRWPGAHPMQLDLALDQLGPWRPTPALAGHATPVAGLYLAGAGSAPAGGIAGTPGRRAARALLAAERGHRAAAGHPRRAGRGAR